MIKNFKSMLLALCALAVISINSSQVIAATCPNPDAVENLPNFNAPKQKGFRHFGNWLLSAFYRPYHMVHDMIVAEGQSTTLVGKFDYDKILHKDLEDEVIHVYLATQGMSNWEYLGSDKTDSDGKIYMPLSAKPVGDYAIKMVVEGDLTEANGYLNVIEANRKTVLFDIDGTLSLSDLEGITEFLGLNDGVAAHEYAAEVVQAYQNKNYQVVFLTGRPYWVANDTRDWLESLGLLRWHLRTNPSGDGLLALDTENYKAEYIDYLINDAKLDIVRAYGNADTDISAYNRGGIPVDETYIIGSEAGNGGTNPIYDNYVEHYYSVVLDTPEVDCQY
ncbi:MAG: haloacid dehalogenase [Pseudomonadota bacterium]